MADDRREGDWDCRECQQMNFAWRDSCFKCNTSKNAGENNNHSNNNNNSDPASIADRRDGDWDCPTCNTQNFAWREACFQCRKPRNSNKGSGNDGGGYNNVSRNDRNGDINDSGIDQRDGDWLCGSCGIHNFARRRECFKCGALDRYARATYGSQQGGGGGRGGGGNYGRGRSNNNSGFGRQRPGDWICQRCRVNNFASRDKCFKCEAPKAGAGGKRTGDWDCSKCGNDNFSWRDKCHKCDEPKPEGEKGWQGPSNNMRPGDWVCSKCDEHNFAWRSQCFGCKAEKADNGEEAEETLDEEDEEVAEVAVQE